MNNFFYIYVLLDANKTGDYSYGGFSFSHEPFYVGKGTKKRYLDHFRESSLKQNSYKNNKIKNLLKTNKIPITQIILESKDENFIFEIETKMIATIGRKNLDIGPLTNLTDGGKGISGLIKTPEHRNKLRLSRLNKKSSETTRKKISLSQIGSKRNLGKKHSEETKNKISKSKIGTLSWNATPIIQLSDNNVFIKKWVSVGSAAKELNLNQGNISSVIAGKRKLCGGYKWKLETKFEYGNMGTSS